MSEIPIATLYTRHPDGFRAVDDASNFVPVGPALECVALPAGTVVKLNGIPVSLSTSVVVLTLQSNIDLLREQVNNGDVCATPLPQRMVIVSGSIPDDPDAEGDIKSWVASLLD